MKDFGEAEGIVFQPNNTTIAPECVWLSPKEYSSFKQSGPRSQIQWDPAQAAPNALFLQP